MLESKESIPHNPLSICHRFACHFSRPEYHLELPAHHFRFSNLTSETSWYSLRHTTDSKPQLVFPSEAYAQFAIGSASGCKSLVRTTFRSRTAMSTADSSIDWCPHSTQRTLWLTLRARASTWAVRTLSSTLCSSAIASTNSLSANLQTNCGQSEPTYQLPMLAINPTVALPKTATSNNESPERERNPKTESSQTQPDVFGASRMQPKQCK